MTEHAVLGASSAYRWMACPGSVRLSEGQPDSTSAYAAEGTAAHMVAEICLDLEKDAQDCVGLEFPIDDYLIPVTDEMAEAVQVYLNYVRNIPGDRQTEVKVDLAPMKLGADMFGTVDCMVWDEPTGHLVIVDYKHGQGTLVEVEDNPQILYYATGAILALGKQPKSITTTIVQPRAEHFDGFVRTRTFDFNTILDFGRDLRLAVPRALDPEASVGPVGDHCKFCRAKAICPAQQENAVVVAQQEFPAIEEATLPVPAALTQDVLLEVLDKAPLVEAWFKDIRTYVQTQLENGEEVEGWKLVAKRAVRKWTSPGEVEAWLRSQRLKVGDLAPRKLVSPAQAEKLLKKKGKALPEHLWEKRSSGYNLARESSPKRAITPGTEAQTEFEV